MSNHLFFDFSVNKETNTITIQREFDAEHQLVWDAYTKSEILDQWWAPKPWKARTKSMEFKKGGHWHYAMVSPEGQEHWGWFEYVNIDPIQSFRCIDSFIDEQGKINTALPQSTWVITFHEKGPQTLVQQMISYSDLSQLELIIQMGFKEGITSAMEGLDHYFSKIK